jgi:hypothetical protein
VWWMGGCGRFGGSRYAVVDDVFDRDFHTVDNFESITQAVDNSRRLSPETSILLRG